jgi:D-alanyl-lipoteichoic acid acyltransferase DltB (MBOAT superfamily)
MAIGLAKMMGIDFPMNFNSPYKAVSMVDFWRRWHMTLSRFLRDYLYIPLGGNRLGPIRRHANLMVTMLLGGLWHGASWNFVLWGGIHGAALVVNHLWRHSGVGLPRFAAWLLTMTVVVLAWVPFRADSLPATMVMWRSLLVPTLGTTADLAEPILWITGLFAIALLLPNMQQLLSGQIRRPLPSWRPSFAWALVFGTGLGIGIAAMEMQNASQFLYFRF